MLKNQVNKDNVYLIHFSIVGKETKIFFSEGNKIFVYRVLTNEFARIISDLGVGMGKVFEIESIKKFINHVEIQEITLDELLNDSDTLMTGTKMFKDRVKPLIRNQKISIINGN